MAELTSAKVRVVMLIVHLGTILFFAQLWQEATAQDIYAEAKKELVEPGVLSAADPYTSPPSCFISSSGEAQGYYVDIVRGFADKMGVKFNAVAIDWPGVLPGLTSVRFDMGGCQVAQTKERLASTDYIASAYYMGQGIRLMVLESSNIRDWDDIKDKTVGGQKGSAELKSVKDRYPTVKSKDYGTFTDIMLDVVNKRIDAGVIPESILAGLIKQNPKLKARVVGAPIDVTTRGTFLPPSHKKMAAAFNKYVAELRSNGQLDALSKKWFNMTFDWKKLEDVWQATNAEAAKIKKK